MIRTDIKKQWSEKQAETRVGLLSHDEMTKQYFSAYNDAEPDHKMEAPVEIRYCLTSRKNVWKFFLISIDYNVSKN